MPLIQTAAPTAEPVTVDEAKNHLRVDEPADDDLIAMLIPAAREYAEMITRRQFVTASFKLTLDQFPAPSMEIASANWYGPAWGTAPGPLSTMKQGGKTGFEIILPVPPLRTVESIKYIDVDGAQQTLDPTQYKVDAASTPARIVPAYGTSWPATRNEINAVEVAFTAGYGDPAAVPAGIKSWILLRLAALYENREEVAVGQRVVVLELPYADNLLNPFRVVSF